MTSPFNPRKPSNTTLLPRASPFVMKKCDNDGSWKDDNYMLKKYAHSCTNKRKIESSLVHAKTTMSTSYSHRIHGNLSRLFNRV